MDIIIDIDGTLSDPSHRLHLIREPTNPSQSIADPWHPNWDAFFAAAADDPPNEVLCDLASQLIGEGNRVVFMTGRPERIRNPTVAWLHANLIIEDSDKILLMMRKDGDHRKDDIVKHEMLTAMRQMGINPTLAIEDRARVVAMYRQEGITVLQCAEGSY